MYQQKQPMAVGDIMESSFRLFTEHWQPLLLVHGFAALPGLMLTVATSVPEGQGPNGQMLLFAMFSMILVYPLAAGAGIKVAADICGAKTPDVMGAIEYAVPRYASLLWVGLLMGLYVALGFLAFFVPGFYLALRFCFANYLVTLTEFRGTGAMARSAELMKGHYMRIVVLVFACVFVMVVFGYGSALVLSRLDVVDMGSLGESSRSFDMAVGIANVVPAAFMSVCLTMVFLDRLHLEEPAADYQPMDAVPAVPTWASSASVEPQPSAAAQPEPGAQPTDDTRFMPPEPQPEPPAADPESDLGPDDPKNSEPT